MKLHEVDIPNGRISFEQEGTGPDLVVLHSLLTDRRAFEAVVPALADRFRVNLVDLPGFGKSAQVGFAIDAHADAVGAFFEAGEFDPTRTVLLGNGLGAFIALGTAVRHGDRFERLCLVGCGARFSEPARETFATMARRVEEGGMEAVSDAAVRRIFPDTYLEAHPEVRAERRRVLANTDPGAFVGGCLALQRVDYRGEAETVANPTLVLVGSEDRATPPAMARELRDRIPGADLIEIDGVGHAPQMQAPDRFLQALEGFLYPGRER